MPPLYNCSVITGTGRYIPERVVRNSDLEEDVYDSDGEKIETPSKERLTKFTDITGIEKRRYANDNQVASDLGYIASERALKSAGVDKETLDYIIFAHNFGDISSDRRTSQVPTLAQRIKGKLEIKNRKVECYDLPFGCPGWVQTFIHTHKFFQGGFGKKALGVGAETLSRVKDARDRDGPLYSDGGGAAVFESKNSKIPIGFLSYALDGGNTTEKTKDKSKLVYEVMKMGPAYGPKKDKEKDGEKNKDEKLFFKMETGRDVFEYALKYMPGVIKESIDKAGLQLKDVKKILIHQANHKLDEGVIKRLFKLYGMNPSEAQIKEIVPMIISKFGNSSVATIPILLDLILRGRLNSHRLEVGDNIVLASIGAGGPNINSIVYRMSGHEPGLRMAA